MTDRGAALHLAADRLGHAADLAGDPDPEAVRMVVAAIALVRRPGLALADALDLGGVQRIGLAAAPALVLVAHPGTDLG